MVGQINGLRSQPASEPRRSRLHLCSLSSLSRGSVSGDLSQAAPRVARATALLRLVAIGVFHTFSTNGRGHTPGSPAPKCSSPGHSDWTDSVRGHAHEAHGRHFAFSARVAFCGASLDGFLSLFLCPTVSTQVRLGKPLPLSSKLKFSLPSFSPQWVGNASSMLFCGM